jgi:hypothetical protein
VSTIAGFGAFAGALLVTILRTLAADEVRGRIQRRVRQSVEHTVASLPEDLQAEWDDEWRAELAAVISMPLTAARYARGLRQNAAQLVAEPALEASDATAARRLPMVRVEPTRRLYDLLQRAAGPRKLAMMRLKVLKSTLSVNLVLASCVAGSARAGTYHVYGCHTPAGDDSWTAPLRTAL